MLSTLFFLLLVAFACGYLTSRQLKQPLAGYQAYVARHPRHFRLVAGALLAGTALTCVWLLGPMTGLSTWLVGLMGGGCLVVALGPLGYLNGPTLITLYVVFLSLELLF